MKKTIIVAALLISMTSFATECKTEGSKIKFNSNGMYSVDIKLKFGDQSESYENCVILSTSGTDPVKASISTREFICKNKDQMLSGSLTESVENAYAHVVRSKLNSDGSLSYDGGVINEMKCNN